MIGDSATMEPVYVGLSKRNGHEVTTVTVQVPVTVSFSGQFCWACPQDAPHTRGRATDRLRGYGNRCELFMERLRIVDEADGHTHIVRCKSCREKFPDEMGFEGTE